MSVNTSKLSDRPPQDLSGQAVAILARLQLPLDDAVLRRRIETFILCNGFHGVYVATQSTAKLITRNHAEAVKDPWPYTIRLFNQNLARSSYLYTLTHWVENGLRSQLDLHHTKYLGATWHTRPNSYMEPRHVIRFQTDHQQELSWRDQAVGPEKLIEEPSTPVEFLQRISFRWLAHFVSFAHKKNNRLILVRADGTLSDPRLVATLLDAAVDIRNDVAHNRPVRNEVFTKAEQQLLQLLDLLRFDVAKALEESEIQRMALIHDVLRRMRGTAPT